MTKIFQERMTAEYEGEFVVFLIGMRVNKLWKVHKWLPVATAMTGMLKELYANPELGLLSHESWFGRTTLMLQYWKSFEHLENYARQNNSQHLPAWQAFNAQVGNNGDVGIWHETYVQNAGNYENIYNNMPRFGLARIGKHVAAKGALKSASGRMYHRQTE